MLAIGEAAQSAHVRADAHQEILALLAISHLDHLLHHIIGVLIFHHRIQVAV